MRLLTFFIFTFFLLGELSSQQSNDIKQSIISEAIFDTDGNLTISWFPKSDAQSYNIRYREDLSSIWQIEANDVIDSFYVFSKELSFPVEISIQTQDGEAASSYLLVGHEYFKADQSENMLIFIVDSVYQELETIILDYQNVLSREMIQSEIIVIDESYGVPEVKNEILTKTEESTIDYILLVGHIPVPYSGNGAIDGHTPDHKGAWVADGYYGELDGIWTDYLVDNSAASRDANKNVPDDGKFDSTIFPSKVDIPVGRIDFSYLPKLVQGEIELTRRYFQRNIDYRSGLNKAPRRAIIDNNFNLAEGFAQGAIKSYHSFLEPDSINYNAFSQCYEKEYLFTFGAGGGSYQSAGGITSTNALVNDSIQSVFTTIFGSYFGDWDIENNLLRAALARGNSLINAWSGRPIWYFHHMAMGHPVGDVLVNTQNNNGIYASPFGNTMCHISLMGDPSLQMYYHEAVNNITSNSQLVEWEYSAEDEEVVGYTIYFKENEDWKLLGDGPIEDNFISLSDLPTVGITSLLIRPVGLIQNRSGSYFNEGIGTKIDVIVSSVNDMQFTTSVYPNPAHSIITIESHENIEEISIFNALGVEMKKTFGENQINIENLNSGVYFLLINDEVIRFVKE